jgi:hypothetical protein
MVRAGQSKSAAAAKCRRSRDARTKPPDPIRDLAIEIVELFAGLLREEEIRDAFLEVYERIKGRLTELKAQE